MLEGKKNAMNREKITALDSIGFFWNATQKDGGQKSLAVGTEGGGAAAAAAAGGLDIMGRSPPFRGRMREGYGEDADDGSSADEDFVEN